MGRRRSAAPSAGTKRSRDGGSAASSKKKDGGQKTLGVAWGASSKSASSTRYSSSPFSDFSSYMECKNRKLRDQFVAGASTSAPESSSSTLFRGISIFVDGFTVPSHQELKSYMMNYGGRFENYFSRHRVSHIICSNLPDCKLKNLRSFSGGLPVVEPAWILDCVAADRILSWLPYQLNQITGKARDQRKLSDLYALKSGSKTQDSGESGENAASHGSEKSSEFFEADFYDENECIFDNSEAILSHDRVKNDEDKMATTVSGHREKEEQAMESAAFLNTKQNIASDSPCLMNSMTNGEEKDAKFLSLSSNNPYSICKDSNFVENYFKKSRLHFIGTWRNRYRKRFPEKIESKCSSGSEVGLQNSNIMHIDMDCFFVSVVIRNHPELHSRPVAVCHSDNPNGTAEISSANYPARDFGIKAGMFVKDAKGFCPSLVIVPYNFDAYEEVADQFYEILHKYCNNVQAISCDEAFLDLSCIDADDPQRIASNIREEIFRTTRCTASAGIGSNMLIARLATKEAKPNGMFYIQAHEVSDYINNLPIKALPGIGHALASKLFSQNIETCGQLRAISKEALQKDFGSKTGDMLWNYARGIDNRKVGTKQEVKSIGAEVNWGVRFDVEKEAQDFLVHLSNEVSLRLRGSVVVGRTITLKVKRRRKGAEEPIKYMGCGDCDNLSHSITLPAATDDVHVLQKVAKQLFASFHVDVKEVRGVGLQVSRLENVDCQNQGRQKNSILSWLASASKNVGALRQDSGHAGINSSGTGQTGSVAWSDRVYLPDISEVDMKVIDSLPSEIVSEINALYGGELTRLMHKTEDGDAKLNTASSKKLKIQGKQPICSSPVFVDGVRTDMEVGESSHGANKEKISYQSAPDVNMICGGSKCDLLPASLSQVDHSVLQELPLDIRDNLLKSLPPHRFLKCPDKGGDGLKNCGYSAINMSSISTRNLCSEQPPRWINKFTNSDCLILNAFAEVYMLGHDDLLSTALQKMSSQVSCFADLASVEYQEATVNFCELIKDYIHLKIDLDIEEIYLCFRILSRSTKNANFLQHVYDLLVPSLQAAVNEHYGGTLRL